MAKPKRTYYDTDESGWSSGIEVDLDEPKRTVKEQVLFALEGWFTLAGCLAVLILIASILER